MNAETIKATLAGRAEEFCAWLFPAGRRCGPEWQVGSLSGEPGRSLSIRIRGAKTGVFADFATNESGDNLVELLMQARGVSFGEALRECAGWLGLTLEPRTAPPSVMPRSRSLASPLPFAMSGADNKRAHGMAAMLRNDQALCERIARARGWRTETIADLAHEPSLGWHEGKLVFLYESGAKLRWREKGERIIRWAFGTPWLWRGWLVWTCGTIYVCEGETDTIALIDAGVEKDGQAAVIGLPSATTFNREWAQLFQGKDVILALDGDNAGQEATDKIAKLLQPVAKSVRRLNWEGLRDAC